MPVRNYLWFVFFRFKPFLEDFFYIPFLESIYVFFLFYELFIQIQNSEQADSHIVLS